MPNFTSAPSATKMSQWSNEKLVNKFMSASITHCEMDNSSEVGALRKELLRRLNGDRNGVG